jgi:hypothetical protein
MKTRSHPGKNRINEYFSVSQCGNYFYMCGPVNDRQSVVNGTIVIRMDFQLMNVYLAIRQRDYHMTPDRDM